MVALRDSPCLAVSIHCFILVLVFINGCCFLGDHFSFDYPVGLVKLHWEGSDSSCFTSLHFDSLLSLLIDLSSFADFRGVRALKCSKDEFCFFRSNSQFEICN